MAPKSRQRISYVLPLANNEAGHRLGVNGLAVDPENSILYSGGRDGIIYAWSVLNRTQPLRADARQEREGEWTVRRSYSTWKHVQAHSHWINDLTLVQSNSAVVSASSDISVKIWRPHAQDSATSNTIGLHGDYVKCLSSPGRHSSWIASGALDHKVMLWDLTGAGPRLQIDTADDGAATKGSVYAIAANENLLASGGPENVVKLWDPRTGKRVTKFVGHTDNVRSILVSEGNDLVMSASSDQTIKVWSMAAGRCLNTLTMHSDSVRCLHSDHPQLSLFYSADRSGLLAKTDARCVAEIEDGLCVAICKENDGINKIACTSDHVWSATSSSSINQWTDVETDVGVHLPDNMRSFRWSSQSKTRMSVSSQASPPSSLMNSRKTRLPLSCVLRVANTSNFPPHSQREVERTSPNTFAHSRKSSSAAVEAEGGFAPLRPAPEETIEGQHGLIKHVVLNDKRRVLTLDTAGDVTLWDIIQCTSIGSFGKRHLDDVVKDINTVETLPYWCAVDTRTGALTCVLEAGHCFDAEMYADELQNIDGVEFREDQRSELYQPDSHSPECSSITHRPFQVNLGKWVLRCLFEKFVEEEFKKDEVFRQDLENRDTLAEERNGLKPDVSDRDGIRDRGLMDRSALPTPRAAYGQAQVITTPISGIGNASPALLATSPSIPEHYVSGSVSTRVDPHLAAEKSERSVDYFSSISPSDGPPANETTAKLSGALAETTRDDGTPLSPTETTRSAAAKDSASSLSKRLRMSFGGKKAVRPQIAESNRPPDLEEKRDSAPPKNSDSEEKSYDDCLFGVIQRIQNEYMKIRPEEGRPINSMLTPIPACEAPLLEPHVSTKIIIQEENQDSGGVADLFEGSIGTLASQVESIEKVAPPWLGDLLLLNRTPSKEIIKVSFTLEPFQKQLPYVTDCDGTERLNANRMLRARKIIAYIAERLPVEPVMNTEQQGLGRKPENWLQLYCQKQNVPKLLPPKMTLATIRHHVWRGGGDVALVYKLNPLVEVFEKPRPGSGKQPEKPLPVANES